MATLTYFTARLYYKAVVADMPEQLEGDVDTDPDTNGINAGVTITPFLRDANGKTVSTATIVAATLTPPTLIALAPIRARLDGGQLKLTALQADVRLVAQTAVLGLEVGTILGYEVAFNHVTFNGGDQQLPSFKVQAPTTDVVLDLATAARI